MNQAHDSIHQQPSVKIDKDLLAILCCPETKQDVSLADKAIIVRLNDRIRNGTVKNRGGHLVQEPIDGGLIRADHAILYPIRDDIPVMLIDEAIPLDEKG